MTTCGGRLLGYLAVPNTAGVRTFLPIRCNAPHATQEAVCCFTDVASGLIILPHFTPTICLDQRGCVHLTNPPETT